MFTQSPICSLPFFYDLPSSSSSFYPTSLSLATPSSVSHSKYEGHISFIEFNLHGMKINKINLHHHHSKSF